MDYFELNNEQIFYLEKIKKLRFNFLTWGLYGTVVLSLISFFSAGKRRGGYIELTNEIIYIKVFTGIGLLLISLAVLYIVYLKKIKPLQKDIFLKTGEVVRKQIIRKTDFPHTNQYFLFFEDEKMPNKEISHEEFYKFSLGDFYSVYRGKHSKIIFDSYGNFEVL